MLRKVLLLICCLVLSVPSIAQQLRGSSFNVEEDKAAIETVIKAYAKAMIELPNTRNPETVLRFAAGNFSGVENGKRFDLKSVREGLDSLVQQVRAGRSIKISVDIENIKVQIDGNFASATYEAEVKTNINGNDVYHTVQDCVDKFERRDDTWLIVHSTVVSVDKLSAKNETSASNYVTQQPSEFYVVNETFNVSAGSFRLFNITTEKAGVISGRFDVGGSRWSDIKVFIVPLEQYDNLRNNRAFRYWYMSGQVASGSIYAYLPPGQHVLFFSNVHSSFVSASITASIKVKYY